MERPKIEPKFWPGDKVKYVPEGDEELKRDVIVSLKIEVMKKGGYVDDCKPGEWPVTVYYSYLLANMLYEEEWIGESDLEADK